MTNTSNSPPGPPAAGAVGPAGGRGEGDAGTSRGRTGATGQGAQARTHLRKEGHIFITIVLQTPTNDGTKYVIRYEKKVISLLQ